MFTVSTSSWTKLLKVPTPAVMGIDPLLNVICGLGKPELTHRIITDVPLSKQGGLERNRRPVTSTGTAREKETPRQVTSCLLAHSPELQAVSIPGTVTNTPVTSVVPAALMS